VMGFIHRTDNVQQNSILLLETEHYKIMVVSALNFCFVL
jgi:hypothetical protein